MPRFFGSAARRLPALVLSVAVTASVASAQVLLPTLDGSHTGPRATNGASRPVAFRHDAQVTVNPSRMAAGESATFSTRIRVSPTAAIDGFAFNLLTVGLLSQQAGPVNGTTPFLGTHDGDAIIWYQNNTRGTGVAWNKQFYSGWSGSGPVNFVFGAGTPLGGYPNDNATQDGAFLGSWADYRVTIFANNTFSLSVGYLDVNGNPLVGPNFGAGIGSVPQVLTGTLGNPANTNYSPFLRLRAGAFTDAEFEQVPVSARENVSPNDPWAFDVQHSQLVGAGVQVVPEPATVALTATGLLALAGAAHRRRRG